MDESDESTAVFSIRKNFNEFISGMSGSSVNSRLEFDGDGSVHQQAELISARGQVSHLQLQLMSAETARKRVRIECERDVEKTRKDQQREQEKTGDLKRQLVVIARKEEQTRQELSDTKKLMESSLSELKDKLLAVQKEKMSLESSLQELKQDSRSKISELKIENAQLSHTVQKSQNELHETRQLLQIARRESTEVQKLQLELVETRSKLSQTEQQVKELELTLSRAEEDVKVGKAMKAQLNRLGQLETENKKLMEENQYLKAIQENTLVLREECESLRKKFERSDERCIKLSAIEVECEDVKKRLSEWEAIECCGLSGLKSPAQLSRTLADLQRNNELLLENNGQLKASVHSLEASSEATKQQLQKSHTELITQHEKLQQATDNIKLLNRKILLVTKERDGYKNMLESYESELTMSANVRSDLKIRQGLEDALDTQRKHSAALESELEKAKEQSAQNKTRAMLLEQQLKQFRETHLTSALLTTNTTDSSDENIVIELRQQIANLEKNVESLTEEKEQLLAQLERYDIQGEYDRSKTKVVQYSMNPFSVANRKLTADLTRLRDENSKLLQRLKIIEESRGNVEDLTTKVDERLLQTSSGKEVEEIKAQLVSAELKNKRLMEAFKKTSQELREVSYQLLGYRIDIPTTGQYRLMNIYAESPNDYFIFKQSGSGELQMLGNDYSATFVDQIKTFLHGADSIPAFLSSVTLELCSRQTFMQGRSFC